MEGFYNITSKTNIENWYHNLKKYTIKTSFLDLSKDEALILIKLYENKYNLNSLSSSGLHLFHSLENRIDSEITLISSSKQAFVRLSTRSPKDSKKARDKRIQRYKEEINNVEHDDNKKTLVLLKSYLHGLRVTSGAEALEILCDSERVYDDLRDAIDNSDPFSMNIGIREWVDIPFDMEFRGFVKGKQLTALTQYYHYIYFKDLPQQKEIITKAILKFFDEIKDIIQLSDYIVDFVVLQERILVLELNPFVPGTEAGLFSWKTEKNILECGPFEFRIRTEPIITK